MRIAIVGGGATGALVAVNLARRLAGAGAEITVIEGAAAIGRGVAYSTRDRGHLLNVRACDMSAFADDPDHFSAWLEQREEDGAGRGAFRFIPRATYGAYIGGLAREAEAAGAIQVVRDICVDAIEAADSVAVRLASGEVIMADQVVLATGHDAKLAGRLAAAPAWSDGALDDLPPDAPVLLIGSGLTMVDVAVSLDGRGHRGPMLAVSRREVMPTAHQSVGPLCLPAESIPFGANVSKLTAWLRGLAAETSDRGGDWRSVVDALRPHTQRLWRSMSTNQKRRFLGHARPYWDAHRHRMAPEVARRIAGLRGSGRLTLIAGRVLSIAKQGDGLVAQIVRRGASSVEDMKFARAIDCTGLPEAPDRSPNPIIRALLDRGAARRDPLGVGLDVGEDFALIGAGGRRSRRIRVVGPPARAAFWECIAIPDIRLQCQELAGRLAAEEAARV